MSRVLQVSCPRASQNVVHERLHAAPHEFSLRGPTPANQTLTFRIGLQNNNFAGLEAALYASSTPGSPQYGQHLTREEVSNFMAPSPDAVSQLHAWLATQNITSTSANRAGDWVRVSMTVGQANALFDTTFSTFTHAETGTHVVRTMSYSIPLSLAGHVNFVYPTVHFPVKALGGPAVKKVDRATSSALKARAGSADNSCLSIFNVTCAMDLYGIPWTAVPQTSNRLVVPGFVGEYANEFNLAIFLNTFRPDMNNQTTWTLETIDGGINDQTLSLAGSEANLDTQWTIGVANGVNVTFFSVGPDNIDSVSGFLDLVEVLTYDSEPLTVLSTSYAFNEANLNPTIAQSMCDAYAALTAQGVSIIFSSGDGGVSGGQTQSCTTFQPTFPSTCPYVTSVGATSGVNPEGAAYFSGGGFSNIFARPSYQNTVVPEFLSTIGNIYSGLYSPSGRAFPDVSAAGDAIEIVWQTEYGLVGGTSASTPIFASIIAMINSELMAAGKPPLGFLNNWIYQNPSAFTDITYGSNPGCNQNGFPAGTGWDPVTGFGSPLYDKLRTAAGL
ncbi:family S53 protease [Vararia minispora EC-137]|uniref:Family S53 protease n=1 Tax=Vararia minispora EC-137 TaxID=1314806 RepID=A0ACB8QAB3_9AGAM|nr:family S53 protease [Vararia minispora EC-137]